MHLIGTKLIGYYSDKNGTWEDVLQSLFTSQVIQKYPHRPSKTPSEEEGKETCRKGGRCLVGCTGNEVYLGGSFRDRTGVGGVLVRTVERGSKVNRSSETGTETPHVGRKSSPVFQ